jgi:hypothetical protein
MAPSRGEKENMQKRALIPWGSSVKSQKPTLLKVMLRLASVTDK